MTEASGIISLNHSNPLLASVGSLTNNISAKIIDGKGNRCGINENGELFLKLKYPFIRYFGNDSGTQSSFDGEGWYNTGDVGHFNEYGNLVMIGRKKDTFQYKNFTITPSEIEGVLIKMDAIKHICVVGIPDKESNNLPAAVIVKNSEITEIEIQKTVEGKKQNLIL